MLPQQTLIARPIGDTQYPYWTAATLDGIELLLEPGESLLRVCYCRVSQTRPTAWTLENPTTLVVTDRRTAFLTTQFDKGGTWVGFGFVGLAIALTANEVSKHRAAQRSAGQVAIGQVRHEWITGMTLRRKKALIGVVDTYIDLTIATEAGSQVIELWSPKGQAVNEEFARWLASTISGHRMALLNPASPADLATLRRYSLGGQDAAPAGNPNDLGWRFPGKTDELIAKVIAPLISTPESAGRLQEGAT
jgi:hypothetical protein